MILFNCRTLLNQLEHPLHITTDTLQTRLADVLPGLQVMKKGTLRRTTHDEESSSPCAADYVLKVECVDDQQSDRLPDDAASNELPDQLADIRFGEGDVSDTNYIAFSDVTLPDETSTHGTLCNGGKSYRLIGSLLHHIPSILLSNPIHPSVMTSEVCQRCSIATDVLPIMHQMLVLIPQENSGALWDDVEQIIADAVNSITGNDGCQFSITLNPMDLCCNASGIVTPSQHALCNTPKSVRIDSVSAITLHGYNEHHAGIYGVVTYKEQPAKFALLSLDHLVMKLLNIKDLRTLWTENPREWDGIRHKMDRIFRPHHPPSSSPLPRIAAFRPHSKYSPRYQHDVSLWVKTDSAIEFDELGFLSIVRGVAGLLLEEVKLLERYEDETSCRYSLCYRIVYRSVDRALTKEQSNQIQSTVRAEVGKTMPVEIR